MKKRLIAFCMALALVVSMAGVSLAAETQSDGLSGLMDLFSGIAGSTGSEAGNQEKASDNSEGSNIISSLGSLVSGIGSSTGSEAGNQEQASGDSSGSEVISGLGNLISGIANSAGGEAGNQEQAGESDGSNMISGITDLISSITGTGTIQEEEDLSIAEEAVGDPDSLEAGSLIGAGNDFDADESINAGGIAGEMEEMDYDTLVDLDIQVPVPDGVLAVFSSDGYTLYATGEERIPYVRVNGYRGYSDEETCMEDLIRVMSEDHADAEIIAGPEYLTLEERTFYGVVFEYDVQGYAVEDTRLITTAGDFTYMFTAKDVPELDQYVGDLLEIVAVGSIFLSEDTTGGPEDIDVDEPEDLAENEIVWEELEPEVNEMGLEGGFVTIDQLGLEMWVPNELSEVEPPETQPGEPTNICVYANDTQDCYAAVQFLPVEMTLEEFAAIVESMGDMIEGLDLYVINGLPAAVYFIPDNDGMYIDFEIEGEGIVEFIFVPVSDEDFGVYSEVMGASIQPAE